MNEEDLKFYNMQDKEELIWMCISRDNRIKSLEQKINQYENPDDLTLFYMWLDEKAKDKMKELQQRIDKAIEYIESHWIEYEEAKYIKMNWDELEIPIEEIKELLEILKGGNNENNN